MERELKLEIDGADIERLRNTPLLASLSTEPPHTEELVSTYFDTPDGALREQGLSLRVRTAGKRQLQTLKNAGSMQAGMYSRAEYETPVPRKVPDLKALLEAVPRYSPLRDSLCEDTLAARLAPLFTTRVQRTIWLLRLPEGADVELALDEGTVEAQDRSTSFSEVELELKSGAPHPLYGLALTLLQAVPMRFSYRSKSDRGYALLQKDAAKERVPAQHEAVHAQALVLKKHLSAEQAFQRIAANCLAQIQGNERDVFFSTDAASVHQMRVGLRRLRSALDLFKPVLDVPEALREELSWIAGELGEARDWHVLASATLPKASANVAHDADTRMLQHHAAAVAKRNRERAAQAVASPRYAQLMIELTIWLEQSAWRDAAPKHGEALKATVKQLADKMLRARHRKLIKRGRHLPDLDPQQRHRARIAAKKLRYATEFFASLYPNRTMRRYITALGKLQDDLGWRNDAVVADELLKGLASQHPETAASAAYVRGFLAAHVVDDYAPLQALWKRFKRLSSPR
jgi:triphosphatase